MFRTNQGLLNIRTHFFKFKMISFLSFVLLSSQLIGLSYSMNLDGASTGYFLDVLMKSQQKNEKTSCDRPSVNQTQPYFFGVTDLKCLNIEARLRRHGYDVDNLRQKFPRILGKRSVATATHKRRSPARSTLRPVHRWIFYNGYFIEFGAGSGNIGIKQIEHVYPQLDNKQESVSLSNANIQALYPKNGDICSAKMESEVAGYSSVSLGCLHKCARSYVSKFGKYHLIKNNCHRFANIISDILCTGICPEWCI